GYVVDFLDFQIAGRHWPAFNIADSAICVGVALYLILLLRHPHHAGGDRIPTTSLANTLTDVTPRREK
ncbi:MAG: signal peptidase II, partial [Verrucomicrobiae bacterium]|nr:signal peptidase II [Verrucomicrobiae bacterium]